LGCQLIICSSFCIFALNCGYAHDLQVRDELEHLLDDDADMAEMYLTEKLVQRHKENSSASSTNEADDIVDECSQSDMDDDRHVVIYTIIFILASCFDMEFNVVFG
jgi:hypothetical protein